MEKEKDGEEEKERGRKEGKEEEETVQACNPSIWEAETGGFQVPGPRPAWATQGDCLKRTK